MIQYNILHHWIFVYLDLETNDCNRENEPSCSGTFSDFGDSDDPDMYEETTLSVEDVINELSKTDESNQDIHHGNLHKDFSVLSNNGGTTSHNFHEITTIKSRLYLDHMQC